MKRRRTRTRSLRYDISDTRFALIACNRLRIGRVIKEDASLTTLNVPQPRKVEFSSILNLPACHRLDEMPRNASES